DHAAITDHHDLLDTKILPDLLHDRQQRLGVVDIPGEDGYRDGTAKLIGHEAVVDLQRALLSIPAVAEPSERTATTLEVARGHVVEDESSLLQMPSGQLLLDHRLAFEQPVHRGVEVILVRPLDTEPARQRCPMPSACSGKLATRVE